MADHVDAESAKAIKVAEDAWERAEAAAKAAAEAAEKATEAKVEATKTKVQCPQGHVIDKAKQGLKWYQFTEMARTQVCDNCRQQFSNKQERWRCNEHCDYNLCTPCHEQLLSKQMAMREAALAAKQAADAAKQEAISKTEKAKEHTEVAKSEVERGLWKYNVGLAGNLLIVPAIAYIQFVGEALARWAHGDGYFQALYSTWAARTAHDYFCHIVKSNVTIALAFLGWF